MPGILNSASDGQDCAEKTIAQLIHPARPPHFRS
jgi:hypothetical protein